MSVPKSNNIFLKDFEKRITFNEFKRFVKYISSQLEKQNLQKNDLVLLDIRNPFYFAGYVFACLHLKLKPALLNFYFKQDQIDAVLKNNMYSLFITDQKITGFNVLKIDSSLPFQYEDGDLDISKSSEIIFYTSGSIQSKACVLTLENFFFNAQGSKENIPFNKSDTWGLCLPLFHVGGFSILIRAMLSEACVAVIDNQTNYSDQLTKLNVTHISFVSTQFIRFLEEANKTDLQVILLGGSSIPEVALKKAIDLKLPIYKSYGMTEMASQICTTQRITNSEDLLNSGNILRYRDLKIEDQKIYVKGPCLFKGYLENNSLKQPFDSGWFDTNDCGELENGKIKILGRVDRIFQSAGENICPELIEQELLRIPGVMKAFVYPEKDDIYGQRAIAYIDKKESTDDKAILSHINSKLSGLHRPKDIRTWKESPKSTWK
jgi:O-succinylbenzoic acid--CoA ligase